MGPLLQLFSALVTIQSQLPAMQPLDWSLLPRAALGVLALLAGNGYIVGINQVYDVEIDAVNKPFLPIASGGGGLPVYSLALMVVMLSQPDKPACAAQASCRPGWPGRCALAWQLPA